MSESGDEIIDLDDEGDDEFREDDEEINPDSESDDAVSDEEGIDKGTEVKLDKEVSIIKKPSPKSLLPDTVILTIVKPEDRKSRPTITSGEWAALIAYRVATLQKGEPIFLLPGTEIPTGPIDIAILELKQKQSPLLIIRNMGKTIELWDPNTMIHPRID